ncbi:MAG: MFS transporter [SAR86 cluster bacterium]|uniref:MFS transporter n=1 Tax=SAR86 cluster bacterium TaxID=2030880 RepID=A0A2A4X993_9GAMM|nr:MAG: MFS transporter [SAR86 cluster bacterium]
MNSLGTPNIRWEMRIVISMCLGYGMLMLCRTVVGVAGPAMLADPALTLDTATFGAILGWGTAGNLTGKLTTGVLADKLGGSRVFIWAVALAAIATFIFGTLSTNITFFALYFLTVFAKSAGWPSMANIIRVGFVQAKHGRVWGFIATSSRISSVATTLLVSSLLLIMSWRGLFYMAGALALVSAIILPRYLKSSMQGSGKLAADAQDSTETISSWSKDHPLSKTETRAAIRVFISNPRFWLISLGVSSLAVLFEFQVFLPIYLSETFSLMPAQAGMASSAFPLGCLVAVFSGGFIYDKLSKKNIVYTMSATLIVAVLCLLSLRLLGVYDFGSGLELTLTIGLIFVFGFAISPAYYIPMSVFSIGFGGKHCGLLVGLIDAFAYFGAMMFDFIGGAVANKEGGWEDFILILIVTSMLATIIMTTFLYLDYRDSERDFDLALPS